MLFAEFEELYHGWNKIDGREKTAKKPYQAQHSKRRHTLMPRERNAHKCGDTG